MAAGEISILKAKSVLGKIVSSKVCIQLTANEIKQVKLTLWTFTWLLAIFTPQSQSDSLETNNFSWL